MFRIFRTCQLISKILYQCTHSKIMYECVQFTSLGPVLYEIEKIHVQVKV